MGTTISVRFEDTFLDTIQQAMKGHHYSTKAEFIREAIRDKIKDLEAEKALFRLQKAYGASTRKTTDEQLRNAKEEAFEEIAGQFS